MTASLPKLRSDLERREHASPQGTAVVIKDPASGEFFRLKNAESFIAQQLDGATPLEVIRSRTEERFGTTLPPETLAGFIKTLDRNGLLESDKDGRQGRPARPSRLSGHLLYLRFKVIDPDRLLNALIKWVRFCFTPQFLVLSASLIFAAGAVSVFNWAEILQAASQLYRLSTVPLLVATIFCVVTAHEFAHGLTCKHFGGQVGEMGFMLLYFQPAFYCNVSDAWLFPEKSKRLWVGFAGPYFELFLWALATLTWRVTDAETSLNHVALIVMATSGIKTLLNFNPLIKFDGYYLLSDALDIPNLRKRSFRYLGDFLKRLGGLWGPLPDVSRRERRIYLAYGVSAWLFSVSFLAVAAWAVGGYLLEQHQRLAFLSFSGLAGLRLKRKFGRLFHHDAETPRPSKRRWAALKRPALLGAAAAALLILLTLGRMELRVAGLVQVLPIHNADVRTEVEGILEEIYVTEGARVNQGDIIARLSDRECRSDLQKIQAEIQQTQAKLDLLIAGPTPAQTELARAAVAKAEDILKFAKLRLAADQALFDQQLVSRSALDNTLESVTTAEHELTEAQGKLQVLLEGSRPEEIRAAQAERARLEAQRHYLDEQLRLLKVLSPATGIVTTPTRQLEEMLHQLVHKGDLIAKLHQLNTVTVEAAISEKEIADVQIGQTVSIKTRAYPDHVFYGRVTAIATTSQGSAAAGSGSSTKASSGPNSLFGTDPAATAIRVATEIDNSAGLLKPGMTGLVKIHCGERRMIDLVTRRLSRTFRVEFWSWW